MKRRRTQRGILASDFNRRLRLETLEARLALTVWSSVNLDFVPDSVVPFTRVTDFELYSLNTTDLLDSIDQAPHEFSGQQSNVEISIPNPNGQLERFVVYSSPIMEPALAAAFPQIQTFSGQGIDNPSATLRFDFTPIGFHAQVLSPDGAYYVDPYSQASLGLYASYFKSENVGPSFIPYPPIVSPLDGNSGQGSRNGEGEVGLRNGTQLREYRTAVAATGEYTLFHAARNPTVPAVEAGQAAIVTAMNRVAGVYRTELSITFVLVANNQSLVFTNPATDPYTNNSGVLMLGENQRTIDSIIGNANYDIGHVFSTGGGGVASLGSVGIDGRKAQGVTGLPAPIDDAFYIDFVAHELGHQFGGNHSFNGIAGNCVARNGSTAYEPGSGTTIMAYAGICGADNIQRNSDPFMHSITFDEAIRHVDTVIPNVGRRIPTGNSVPQVNAGADFTIPARTPFVLTATGLDANATDVLTYGWEQRDLGPAQNVSAGDNGSSPLFRFWPPTESSSRYFPRLSDLANNRTAVGERLPTTNRNMNFRAVVRDNRFTGGGVNTDDMLVRVVDTGTPFAVTVPNTAVTWDGLSAQSVSWAVAGTDTAPISATNVDIFLSTDGGLTYPIPVAQRVPNTGQANIFVPNVNTTQARIKVRANNNIFFDISDANFTINAVPLVLSVAPASSTYIEDSPAILIADQTTVTLAQSLTGMRIDVSIVSGSQPGDNLLVDTSKGVTQSGTSLLLNGTAIATVISSASTAMALQLTSDATLTSLETLIRSFAFLNTTDNPRSVTRTIGFVFAGALRQNVDVVVVPTNDAPSLGAMSLPAIPEDLALPSGQSINQLASGVFSDPDENARLVGVVLVENPQNSQEGTWFYSTGTTWLPIGSVANPAGLVLSQSARIGFLPAPDYFGLPAPLMVRALDDTYAGQFTTAVRVLFDPSLSLPTTISANAAPISIEVTNVNDPPQANSQSLEISVLQDEPIDTLVDSGLFTDIDSTLTWSIMGSSARIPEWLGFDSQTLQLSGTPRNRDVGVYNLRLAVSDGEFVASIPLIINVVNVNDAPEQLRLVGGKVDEGRVGIQIGTLFAVDPDGDNIFWSSSDPRFSVRDGQVIINTALDYENPLERFIPVSFRATDTGSPSLSSTLDVEIKVRDVNEFFPQLRGNVYRLIDGDPADTLIETLSAPDNDTEQTVRYRLASGDVDDFTVDELTGEFRLANEANIDDKSAFKVFIEAYDDGVPSFATTAQFEIFIDPANFFVPEFDENQVLTFPENLPAGTLVGRVRVHDGDDNPLRFTLLSVIGGNLDWVTLDPLTGDVRLTAAHQFDFESPEDFSLVVRVEETINGGNIVSGIVPISLTDRNDPPIAIGDLTVFPNRFGVPVTAGFEVEDQDPSPTGYTFATQDSRFEVRSGKLALKPTEVLTSAMVGETIDVLVRVTDNGDSSSFADLIAAVRVVAAPAWQNQANPLDVNRDGIITPTDANLIISRLGSGTDGAVLALPRPFAELDSFDIDVTGDNFVSASDALRVINFLNEQAAGRGEGEGLDNRQGESPLDAGSATWLLAYNQIEEELLNRRRR